MQVERTQEYDNKISTFTEVCVQSYLKGEDAGEGKGIPRPG